MLAEITYRKSQKVTKLDRVTVVAISREKYAHRGWLCT
jgi:hypothetical protein